MLKRTSSTVHPQSRGAGAPLGPGAPRGPSPPGAPSLPSRPGGPRSPSSPHSPRCVILRFSRMSLSAVFSLTSLAIWFSRPAILRSKWRWVSRIYANEKFAGLGDQADRWIIVPIEGRFASRRPLWRGIVGGRIRAKAERAAPRPIGRRIRPGLDASVFARFDDDGLVIGAAPKALAGARPARGPCTDHRRDCRFARREESHARAWPRSPPRASPRAPR